MKKSCDSCKNPLKVASRYFEISKGSILTLSIYLKFFNAFERAIKIFFLGKRVTFLSSRIFICCLTCRNLISVRTFAKFTVNLLHFL